VDGQASVLYDQPTGVAKARDMMWSTGVVEEGDPQPGRRQAMGDMLARRTGRRTTSENPAESQLSAGFPA
jgi:hypothetical protein